MALPEGFGFVEPDNGHGLIFPCREHASMSALDAGTPLTTKARQIAFLPGLSPLRRLCVGLDFGAFLETIPSEKAYYQRKGPALRNPLS